MTTPENPKKAYGALKPCASFTPMNVMLGVWRVFELGKRKYGLRNWRKQPVEISTYYNAAQRHLIEFFEHGIDKDPESGESPLAHVIACCMIVLDGIERDDIADDRKKTEVLTPGEVLARNIEYAGGDVPLTAQPQMPETDASPPEAPIPVGISMRAQREF